MMNNIQKLKVTYIKVGLAFTFCVMFYAVPSYAGTEYSESISFCSINTSHKKLFQILREIQQFTKSANSQFDGSVPHEYIVLGNTNIRTRIDENINESSFNQGPEVVTDIFYSYQNYGAPISTIELKLADHIRDLTISGTDKTQVNALLSLSENEFESLGCAFGGFNNRVIVYIALFVLLFALCIFISIKLPLTAIKYILLYLTFYILYLIITELLPWDSWFSGTSVRAEPISFIARHPDLFVLLGLVASFLIPLILFFIKKLQSRYGQSK